MKQKSPTRVVLALLLAFVLVLNLLPIIAFAEDSGSAPEDETATAEEPPADETEPPVAPPPGEPTVEESGTEAEGESTEPTGSTEPTEPTEPEDGATDYGEIILPNLKPGQYVVTEVILTQQEGASCPARGIVYNKTFLFCGGFACNRRGFGVY